jgi:hypothetical protein
MATIDLTMDSDSDDDFAPTTFEFFIGGVTTLDYMTFRLAELVAYEHSKERWQRVRNTDAPRLGAEHAHREIRSARLGWHRFPSVVHAKQLRTTVAGLPQGYHTDVDPDLARRLGLFVLLGNAAAERCCVLIGDREVWLESGSCVVFPAWVVHAGSGFEHPSRIYVLFSNRVLSAAEVQEAEHSSEALGFTFEVPSYLGLDAARVAPPTLV